MYIYINLFMYPRLCFLCRRALVSNLDSSSAWRFRLVAKNRFGTSDPSARSHSLIPGLNPQTLSLPPRVR